MVHTLEDIYEICKSQEVKVVSSPIALAQFDILDHVFGPKWRGVEASISGLETLMPEQTAGEKEAAVPFGGVRLYKSCRSTMYKLIISLAGTDDTDSFRVLRILGAEAQIGSELNNFQAPLERAFGKGIKPADITREMALVADALLSGTARQRFRKSLANLDKLRVLPKVSERGLLPTEPIGKMPKYGPDGQLELPLPPRLAAFCEQLVPDGQVALRAVYRAAVAAGLFEASCDIEPSCLIDSKAIAKISARLQRDKKKQTSHLYLSRAMKAVLDHDPTARHPDVWEELKRVAVRVGFLSRLGLLHCLKTRCDGCAPHQVSQERFDAALQGERLQHNRVRLLKAGELFNELRAFQNDELRPLLPPVDLLIPRPKKRSAPKPQCLPPNPWAIVIQNAKTLGLTRDEVHAIGAVRQKASAQGFVPREITHEWACNTLAGINATSSRARFRLGIACLDALRSWEINLHLLPSTDLGPLTDRRRKGNATLPKHLVRQIRDHAAFRGLSHNFTRSILTGVATIFNKAENKEFFDLPLAEVPLSKIVEAIPSNTRGLPKNWDKICNMARNLESEVRFHWAAEWADLQRLVVAAGIPAKENSVPAIAAVAQKSGLSPSQIDREWAWHYGRALRSDLKITWSRNVERFDALRSMPVHEITSALPMKPLGPMPKTGNRARHDIYPLPIEIECFLEQLEEDATVYSSKQLRETLCFVWRYARESGLFCQGDTPTAQQLLSEQILNNLKQSGIHGLQSDAFSEHQRRANSVVCGSPR